MTDIIIIGGGLAGLCSSILLSRAGLRVTLIEKNRYPFHRVCGEYISNEVLPFLEKHDLFPAEFAPPTIDRLLVSSSSGRIFQAPLDLGGFGISRYTYDHWLAKQAINSGVEILEGTKAIRVQKNQAGFEVATDQSASLQARLVIAAHGKRARLDQTLGRTFFKTRSPYVAVKYHLKIKGDLPGDQIALHNFNGGYCGVSKIEAEKYNLCYLVHRDRLRKYGNLQDMEKNLLCHNPHLSVIFELAEFLPGHPEVINEISFEKKEPVYHHLLMTGDSAGMIAPLCGNGMAMAIHSAKVLSEIILKNRKEASFDTECIEREYTTAWQALFARRLWIGRKIQNGFFGRPLASEAAVLTGKLLKPVSRSLIRQTHGEPFT